MPAFPHSVGSTHSKAIGPPILLARSCFRYWTETVPQGQTGHVPWLMSPTNLASPPAAHLEGVHLSGRLALKERETRRTREKWSQDNILIKAQMFNGDCANEKGGHSLQFILEAWNQLQVMMCRIGHSHRNSSGASQQVAVS